MRFSLLSTVFPVAASAVLFGCSSSGGGGTSDPGSVTVGPVTTQHASTILKLDVGIKNTTAKAIKTIDSIELDVGSGSKKASSIRPCESGMQSPWLVKAGGSATVTFSLHASGPDRQVLEATCLDGDGKPTNTTAIWEFQQFTKLDTNGSDKVKIALNGTYDGDAIWTAQASE